MLFDSTHKRSTALNVDFRPKNVTRTITATIALLASFFLLGQLAYLFLPDFPGRDIFNEEFNLNSEGNFPALFSSLLLLVCSFLLFLIFNIEKTRASYYSTTWFTLSLIFLYLAIDENISLHEYAGRIPNKIDDFERFSGFLYYPWIMPAIVVLGILGFIFFEFIRDLPKSTKRQFLIAAFIYIGGAVGIEAIGANHDMIYGRDNIIYSLIVMAEELCEMVGLAIFINALIKYIIRSKINRMNIQFIFEDDGE